MSGQSARSDSSIQHVIMMNGGGAAGETHDANTDAASIKKVAESGVNDGGEDCDSGDAFMLPFVSGRSPRYEAFLMTGEKMLRLNPKISQNYAKLKHSELPRHTEIIASLNSPSVGRRTEDSGPPFSDIENNASDAFYRPTGKTTTKCKFLQEHAALLRALNEQCRQKSPVSQSESVLAQQTVANGVGPRMSINPNGVGSTGPKTTPEAHGPGKSIRSDSEASSNNFQDGSLVTVHGRLYPSDTDTDTGKSYVVLSDDDRRRRQSKNLGHITAVNELPSPMSPVFLSEPVTPAKGAFTAELTIADDDFRAFSSAEFQDANGNFRVTSKTPSVYVNQDGSGCSNECPEVAFSSSLPPFAPISRRTLIGSCRDSSGGRSVQPIACHQHVTASPSTSFKTDNYEAAKRLAKRLYTLDGFSRQDVWKHLSNSNEFGTIVATEYLNFFNFAGLRIDAALRKFLFNFCLNGETSERERIVSYFSRHYHECNPLLFNSEDDVHTLVCALLLLNTDLHGQTLSKHISSREFISNINQTGRTYPMDLLKSLFQSVKYSPIECSNDLNSQSTNSRFVSRNQMVDDRFLSIPDIDSQIEYKKGWVMRKCVIDNDGKRMPFGRRSWRMFYATLKGMILYLHKDELGFRKGSVNFSRNSIRIHHSLATKAGDYAKKQHVFRLQTASLAEYLFQTSDPQEMHDWINNINFVAACFSSPSLPGAIGSRQSFHRPFFSSAPSKLSFKEQLEMHEARVVDTQKQLSQHRLDAPGRSAKPRVLQDYAEKEIFLIYELKRYSMYAKLLRSKQKELGASSSSFFRSEAAVAAATCLVDEATKHVIATAVEDLEHHHVSRSCAEDSPDNHNSHKNCHVDRYSYRAAINDCMTVPTPEGGYETTF